MPITGCADRMSVPEDAAMARRDETTLMGDGQPEFPATSWTLVLNAAEQERVREALYRLYWRPLYCLLRHRGFSNDDAKEHTQDFLTQILLGRDFLSKVDRSKATKFRWYLVAAFLNHVRSKLRKKRERRWDDEKLDPPAPSELEDAARVFDYEWAVGILQRVLEDVKSQCLRDGLEIYWHVFTARVAAPLLEEKPPLPLPDLCQRYGIASPGKASNMIVTIKRRFQTTLRQHLDAFADSPEGREETWEDFLAIFARE
jgi:DNA-directed RNA polymerase specialized sigma24 family protein